MSSEFEIFTLDGFKSGKLAICPEPVETTSFDTIRDWKPNTVVTMTTVDEFANPDFASLIANTAPQWIQAAVEDFGIPQSDLTEVISLLLNVLARDERVLIHCKGGQGRSGMLAMRLLIEQGEEPSVALQRIRAVRANAVETKEQEFWASDTN